MASAFAGGARKPVFSWTTISQLPATSVATAGKAQAAASSNPMGSPSQREESTNPSAACIQRSRSGSKPRNWTRCVNPSSATRCRNWLFERSFAGDDKARRCRNLQHGAKKGGIVLHRLQSAGSEPHEFIGKTEFTAQRIAEKRVGFPFLDVDAVGKNGEPVAEKPNGPTDTRQPPNRSRL